MKNTVNILLDDAKIFALKMYLSEKKTSLDNSLPDMPSSFTAKLCRRTCAILLI